MANNRRNRWLLGAAVLAILLAAAALAGLHYASKALKDEVLQALGPDSEVGAISVGLSAIEVNDIKVRGPKGWPAEHALRAKRIIVTPDLRGLLSAQIRIHRIRVEQAYLSVWRTRDKRLRLLPGMLEKPAQKNSGAVPQVAIGKIELQDGVLEFFDATVRQPAHKIRLEQLEAGVTDLTVPGLTGRTKLKLEGVVKGVQRNGKFSINGWAELASQNSELTSRMHGVDLVALQPYLIKAAETGVRRGTMDLTVKSTVRANQLRAPGTLTLKDLELAQTGGAMSTFMGIPRQAVISSLKDRKGQIVVQFTLEGNLSDPQFSLNESMSRRAGASVAETLGISLEGLTKGLGGAAEGFGGAIKKLFGD
jgi:hypothetical protein